jgi:hypothetical protein
VPPKRELLIKHQTADRVHDADDFGESSCSLIVYVPLFVCLIEGLS